MSPVVHFNPELHEYREGGPEGPLYRSVTQILHRLNLLRDLWWLDDFYRQRGTAVHRAIDLHFLGLEVEWDFEGAEAVRPRFERFLRLEETANLRPILWETPMLSTLYGYAGTPDYLGPFGTDPLAIVDWKGDSVEPGYFMQVAGGYRGLLAEAARAGEIDVDPGEILTCPAYLVPLGGDSDLPNIKPVPDDGETVNVFRGLAAGHNWAVHQGVFR